MTQTIRWGILSTGMIANKFAEGLAHAPGAALTAVGSRNLQRANAFAQTHHCPGAYGNYQAVANDPRVDVVYIGTPHDSHKELTLMCLQAGKHVLCEKPFALNAPDAADMVAMARAKGLFLMEAVWTRFIPAIVHMRQLIAEGAVGEVRQVTADFGFRAPFDPNHRLFNPALGGGALLDVGIYPLNLAAMVLGTDPVQISSAAHLGQTGVDEQSAYLLRYAGGQIAQLSSATRTQTPQEAMIFGAKGSIKIHAPWFIPDRLTLTTDGKAQELLIPYESNGYNYEATAVMECIRAGKTESAVMPLNETVALLTIMDTIRAQWPLRYPGE